MKAPGKEIYGKSTQGTLKSTFSGLQHRRWQYWSIFIRLTVVASQIYEIRRNSPKIRTYSSSRSSKIIDLDASRFERALCNFLLVITTFVHLYLLPFSIYWRLSFENSSFSPSHPCFCLTPPSEGTPCDINVIYTLLKSTINGLQFSRWQYEYFCICLTDVGIPNLRNPAKFRPNSTL